MPNTPSTTVVVATFNRPDGLQRLVDGLANQETAPDEVIIVDDGSETPADPMFPTSDSTTWSLIHQDNGGPGSARHRGIEHATGDVIVIVDDDMVVTPRLVASHLERHLDGDEVVQGRFENSNTDDRPLFDRFIADQQTAFFDRCAADPSAIDPARLSTGNVSFRRALYLESGGFDLSLRRREDSELGVRLHSAGARFGYNPEYTAQHDEPPESLAQWLMVAHQYGEAEVAIAQRHPDAYRIWELFDQMPGVARFVIRSTMRWPSVMRLIGRASGRLGQLCERFGADGPGVKAYGFGYALHWFAGTTTEFGPTEARRSLAAHRTGTSATELDTEPNQVVFGGVQVDIIDLPGAVDRIIELSQSDNVEIVVTPNVDHLVLQRRDPAFASIYERAALVLADGQPLIMASKLLRLPLTDKVSGSDLIDPLVAAAAANGTKVFLFGATDDTAEVAANKMRADHSDLQIVGISSPWYTPGGDNPDVLVALKEVEASGAELVLLAFGAPKQEHLLHEFGDLVPPACYVCCGASLDFVAGKVSRAPAWISKSGFEWLYRLAKEPRRLWKRYIVRDAAALPIFIKMALKRVTGKPLTATRASAATPTSAATS